MKGLKFTIAMLLCLSMSLMTLAKAENNENHNMKTSMDKKWICETNASSSSYETDKMADETMSKTARKGKEAFDYALKHCRDCTKITCSVEENGQ